MFDIPIDLIEQIEAEECIFFIGPGASIPPKDRLGPPGPALLALELANRLGGQLDDYSLPWVAQFYADRNGKSALSDYISKRLGDVEYRPTRAHHLIAQLPFSVVVSTAQDVLLREAYRQRGVRVNIVLGAEGSAQVSKGTFVQLYGNAEQPATLRLTEDDIRKTIAGDTRLATDLRSLARNNSLLFLGYALDDPAFREFYFQLRLRRKVEDLPRAFLVWAAASEDDARYWRQRHATVLQMDTLTFIQQLAGALARRGKVDFSPPTPYQEPPPVSTVERSHRDEIILEFSKRLGLSGPVESGTQLQPIARSLALVRQVLSEQRMVGNSANEQQTDQREESRGEVAAQIHLQQGNVAWAEGNFEQARVAFEEAIRQDPSLVDAYLSLYFLLVESGESDQAMGVYRHILVRAPDQAFLPARYEIKKILGQTDVGISYCAFDDERDQLVTVTILRRAFSQHTETLNRFVKKVGGIESRRIGRLLECERHHTRNYVVTEYIEGTVLSDRLRSGEKMPLSEAMQVIDQVAEALEDGHRQGVPHLGLEPANIVLNPDGAKLVTYGFSRLVSLARYSGRVAVGSAREYMSPEQRAGADGDGKSDVYALGTILYEMLVGRPPGVGAFEHASELYPRAGEAIDVVISHAREMDPARRFFSVGEMRKELQRISLASLRGWPGQYLRLALSHLSDLYAGLFTWQGSIVVLVLLAIILAIEFINVGFTAGLRGMTRFAWLLLVTSPATGALGYYVVRETARQQGLGSLISNGRGIGASLGWLFTLHLFRVTDFEGSSLGGVERTMFGAYTFVNFLISVAMTLVSLGLIHYSARATEKWRRHYTLGFYLGLGILSLFVVLLSLLRVPFGMFENPAP